jgi:hypothetical protein
MMGFESFRSSSMRDKVVLVATLACAALFALIVARLILVERGGTNSFALVADSFLNARPFVQNCFDLDCATYNSQHYVIFPPLPGVVAMPLVAAFGVETTGFTLIAALAMASALFIWSRILQKINLDSSSRLWILLAVACASPLLFVTMKSNTVWFFAQAIAFPLVSLALHEALFGRLIAAGWAIGLAFLCRQMSIFYAPLILIMSFAANEPLLQIDRRRFGSFIRIAVPIIASLVAYFTYNYWRFGNPFDTGYRYLNSGSNGVAVVPGILADRIKDYGLWNSAYFVFNFFYLFVQGFHADFAEPTLVKLSGLDRAGTSVLAASPWLLYLFFTPRSRVNVFCGLLIAGLAGVTLFYHSNGYSQYNTQRYILDWFPAALLMLANVFAVGCHEQGKFDLFKPLVLWGALLNVAMLVVLMVTKSG